MSTAGRPEANAPAASDIAERLQSAGFVRLVAGAGGDALAAAGLIASGLDAIDTPYQVSVAPRYADAERTTDADVTVALGRPKTTADLSLASSAPASTTAYEVARSLGEADPALALAGTVAAGAVPQGRPLDDAEQAGLARRPGVAIPTADLADGLAYSSLVHGPFSGSPGRAEEFLGEIGLPESPDEEAHRRVASLVAIAVAGDDEGTVRGARRVERFLRPYAGGPVATIGGYADVLDALARTDPGLGVAYALGRAGRDDVLPAWRDHGERAHSAVREATTGRYDGLFVARCDGDAPAGTVARLIRDFRSPEPVVLVVADGEAAAVATDDTDASRVMRDVAGAMDGRAAGTNRRAGATYDADDTEFVVAFREAQ